MIPKPIDPGATTTAVWSADLAIDKENKPKLTEAQRSRFASNPALWREFYPILDGQQPTIFQLGTIPSSRLNELEDLYGTGSRLFWACFVEALRSIKNVPTGEVPTVQRGGLEWVDPQWIEAVFGCGATAVEGKRGLRSCAIEIGMFAYRWNNPTEADVKNS